ncbi:hypothetical protein ALI22I_04055 [Saccharothrix sp. ALI-22-I]|uniref:hypothetical protein n=1 Tax=Saccharothrix sp. ALI-22-I TaxID=1933778 RepID=UPI00097BB919|nr:hypothetical protein [Saccharothrix sp. ALI-22-I]ONI92434.1 hypothetical protein ALI22I_04055 [Saccharothrix sp. ALI-22-I]
MNLWTAVIGAAGAFLGVLVAQAWTSSREKRQWERERQRDAELWKREDQYRFTEHKRELYSDFLGQVHEWVREAQQVVIFSLPSEHLTPEWLYLPVNNRRKQLAFAQDRLQLVSQSVWQATTPITHKLDSISVDLHNGHQPKEMKWLSSGFHCEELIKVMRKDLGVVEHH